MTEPSKRKANGFFNLDTFQFGMIGSEFYGRVEEMAAYLSLMVSTDQSNATSSGGIKSIVEYSGLTRAEARGAVQRLEQAGFLKILEVERTRARTVPRYSLPTFDKRPPLAAKERFVVQAIAAGRQPRGKVELNAVWRAQEKGFVEKLSDGWHSIEYLNERAFVPNSFVRAPSGNSPLRRLVTYGEPGPIKLAVQLYQLQDLMNERGIPPSLIRAYYSSSGVTRIGQHRLHDLEPGRIYTDPETGNEASAAGWCDSDELAIAYPDRFWSDLRALEAMHIVEWSVYSANGKPFGISGFNRPQRPLGVFRNGRQVLDTPESIPAFAAYLIMQHHENSEELTKSLPQLIAQWRELSPIIALENQSVAHVEGVGILRMTHRATTKNTTVWFRDLCKECRGALLLAEQVAQVKFPQLSEIMKKMKGKTSAADAISMKFNEASTSD